MPSNLSADLGFYRSQLKRLQPLARDTWIATHSPISAQKLHALGYISFVWNGCEHDLFSLFASVIEMPEREAWVLVHDLGDVAICSRIKEITKYRCKDPATVELIENTLDVYDLCRKNRNFLSHFAIAAANKPELSLHRPSKKPDSRNTDPIQDDLWDIRRVGRDIKRLRSRLRQLWLVRDILGGSAPSLSKLPRPKLLWTPRPQAPKAPKRQHKSSPGSAPKPPAA